MSLAPSYIRFEETYNDLFECRVHEWDELSDEEALYIVKLIKLCKSIAEDFEDMDIEKELPIENFDDEENDDEEE